MNSDTFNYTECKFVRQFLLPDFKAVYWGEYGSTEWHTMNSQRSPKIMKMTYAERAIIKMMLKLELLIPEIDDDKEYTVQRALGLTMGRIYYMPEEIRKEIKVVLI